MTMTENTLQVIRDFLEACRTKDPRYEQAQKCIVMMTFLSSPELQWEVILEMLRQTDAEDLLGHIAAGPIEGFLGRHGAAWIDRVEAEAANNANFARALTGVWKYMMTDDVWQRVLAAKELVPIERWLPAGKMERDKRLGLR